MVRGSQTRLMVINCLLMLTMFSFYFGFPKFSNGRISTREMKWKIFLSFLFKLCFRFFAEWITHRCDSHDKSRTTKKTSEKNVIAAPKNLFSVTRAHNRAIWVRNCRHQQRSMALQERQWQVPHPIGFAHSVRTYLHARFVCWLFHRPLFFLSSLFRIFDFTFFI